MALKGLIDASLEQESKIAALEKALAQLSNTAVSSESNQTQSDTKRDLGAIKEWLKE
jgi:serine O-acetyltransferase